MACTEARMRQHPVVLVPARHDGARFQWSGDGRLWAALPRSPARHVPAPDVCGDAESRAARRNRCLDVAREAKPPDGQRPGILESRRWIEGYQRIAETVPEMPDTRLVYVADREADILELMQCAHPLGTPADWLIRSQHNRSLPDGGKLWASVLAGTLLGEVEFTLAARQGQAAREVRPQLWASPISLPNRRGGQLSVTCLIAREINTPAGSKPVEWRLLTNRVAESLEAVVELIDWYRCRSSSMCSRTVAGLKHCNWAASPSWNWHWPSIWWSPGDWPVWSS